MVNSYLRERNSVQPDLSRKSKEQPIPNYWFQAKITLPVQKYIYHMSMFIYLTQFPESKVSGEPAWNDL